MGRTIEKLSLIIKFVLLDGLIQMSTLTFVDTQVLSWPVPNVYLRSKLCFLKPELYNNETVK